MKKINLLIILIALCNLSFAQNEVKNDFKLINQYYNDSKKVSMNIKYELFYDGSSIPSDIETGKYVRSGNKFYMQQGLNQMIITDKYMIVIDNEEKIVGVDYKIDEKQIENPSNQNLDTLFTKYSKIEKIDTKDSKTKAYRFYITEGPYIVCDVFFDSKNRNVTQIINVFREKQPDENEKLRLMVLKTSFMNYGNFNDAESIFNPNNYFEIQKGKMELNLTYKKYKLINHLN